MGSPRRSVGVFTPFARAAALVSLLMVAAACSGGGQGQDDESDRNDAAERLTVDLGDGDVVSYLQSLPIDDQFAGEGEAGEIPVVFLHGGSYDATVWADLGMLDEIAATGHRAVAIDLPGKGTSTGAQDADWLAEALDALDIEEAVVVSPSASGPVAFSLLSQDPGRFAGFVPVAPVGGGDFEWEGGEAPETVVVLGEQDDGFSEPTRSLAGEIPGAELVVISDAGHAAYEDQPEDFLEVILPLL